MGIISGIRYGIFGVEESNKGAIKHGTFLVMNAELVGMFLGQGSVGHFFLLGAGVLIGLIWHDTLRQTLWHAFAAAFVGGYVVAFIFAGQYGAFGFRVTPRLAVTYGGHVDWLYSFGALPAFVLILGAVLVEVMVGATASGLVTSGATTFTKGTASE